MKKLLVTILVVFIVFPLFSENIDLASGEWPPYTGENLPGGGYINQVVTEAFATQGVTVNWSYFPWSRTEGVVFGGQYIGTAGYSISQDRLSRFTFNDIPLTTARTVFFVLSSNNFSWGSVDDLVGYTIGVNRGDKSYSELLKNNLRVDPTNNYRANFQKLLSGRIDAFLVNELVGQQLLTELSEEDQSRITVLESFPWTTDSYYFMATRIKQEGAEYCSILDDGLVALQTSGRWDELEQMLIDGYFE